MRAITRRLVHDLCSRHFGSRIRKGVLERGMTTAEYAIGTVAAAGFAALLIKLLSSERVSALLMSLIESALGIAAA